MKPKSYNQTQTTSRQKFRSGKTKYLLMAALLLALPIFLIACEIVEIIQPDEAQQGEVIEVQLTAHILYGDDNPKKGVVSVLVPEDWMFVSGAYSGDIGSGVMLESEAWADSTEIVLPSDSLSPDQDMKWISAISDQAYSYPDDQYMDATLLLQVGQTTGTFDLGYFITNNGYATKDIDFGPPDDNTADTTMNQSITITSLSAIETDGVPSQFVLEQNYPNPFTGSTTIRYALPEVADVTLSVFDVTGREVAVIREGRQSAGVHTIPFQADGLADGVYLYKLKAGPYVMTRKMVVR